MNRIYFIMFKKFKEKQRLKQAELEKQRISEQIEDDMNYMHARNREAAICVIHNVFRMEDSANIFGTTPEEIRGEISFIEENGYTYIPEKHMFNSRILLDMKIQNDEIAKKMLDESSLSRLLKLLHEYVDENGFEFKPLYDFKKLGAKYFMDEDFIRGSVDDFLKSYKRSKN